MDLGLRLRSSAAWALTAVHNHRARQGTLVRWRGWGVRRAARSDAFLLLMATERVRESLSGDVRPGVLAKDGKLPHSVRAKMSQNYKKVHQ